MKGIVLAGGTGSRLWPITRVTSKQLLPVYDKPMIYYPISTLMLAGVRDILIITTPHDQLAFMELLGDGSQFGISLKYTTQPTPGGLAQAIILGESFLDSDNCLMILGDNIFHGVGLGQQLKQDIPNTGAHIFTYQVSDPTQYGVVTLDQQGLPVSIIEKPINPQSNLAVTGLYFFDHNVSEIAKNIRPSARGELEITSVIDWYLKSGQLSLTNLNRGTAWLDSGSPKSLQDAASYIQIIEERTGLKIACLEEIALQNTWISKNDIQKSIQNYGNGDYAKYLSKIAH